MTHTKQEILQLCQQVKDNIIIIENRWDAFSGISIEVECDQCDHEFDVNLSDILYYTKYSSVHDKTVEQIQSSIGIISKKVNEIYGLVQDLREDIPGQILMEV
jgi:predicted GTPase